MIVEDLEKAGHPGISDRNISTWKLGGYVDWLKEQQLLETRLATTKALERYTRSGEIDRIQQNALAVAADQLLAIIAHFNHNRALDLLYQKPELFPKYIAALGALARCTGDLGKAFDVAHARETALRQQSATPSDGVRPCQSVLVSDSSSDSPREHPDAELPSVRQLEPSESLPTTFRNPLVLSPTEANGNL